MLPLAPNMLPLAPGMLPLAPACSEHAPACSTRLRSSSRLRPSSRLPVFPSSRLPVFARLHPSSPVFPVFPSSRLPVLPSCRLADFYTISVNANWANGLRQVVNPWLESAWMHLFRPSQLAPTGWFDDTFPWSVCRSSPDRARSGRVLTFPHLMYTLWKVADQEYHTSHHSYPAHEHTRFETHESDQLTDSNYGNMQQTVRFSTSCEQLQRAAASGLVREARGGSLHAAARSPAS